MWHLLIYLIYLEPGAVLDYFSPISPTPNVMLSISIVILQDRDFRLGDYFQGHLFNFGI